MASWSYKTSDETITFIIKGVPRGELARVFLRTEDGTTIIVGENQYVASTSSSSFSVSFDVLEEYTAYVCRVGYPANPVTWLGEAKSFETGSFSVAEYFDADIETTKTTDSISARLCNIDTNCESNEFRCTFYVAGNKVSSFTFNSIPSSGTTAWRTKTGLKPGTRYSVSIEIEDLDTGWSNSWSTRVTTDKIVVASWSWSSSNGTASASQTKAAYTALTNNGSTSDFSYLVWNDMCSKVIEIENAAGLTWSTKYASYADTKMSSSDKVLTATRFNSLRYNIGRSYSTDIQEVSSGDTVYAWYFTTLARCMNEWINQL